MANADLDKQPDSVSSVLKVFGILQALGEEREIGITELSQRVMMSKSTVYRFLQTMKTLGYVAQEGESEKYSLTLKLFELGARALQNVDLIRSADIQMRELSRLTKKLSILARWMKTALSISIKLTLCTICGCTHVLVGVIRCTARPSVKCFWPGAIAMRLSRFSMA
ncbi:transcriptional regulator KdgR [Salmonella enterica]|nr:transcriptional regulator KdgR [Salmonella enterica]